MLIVTAHCDDLELGLGAAIPKLASIEPIHVVVMTKSGYTSQVNGNVRVGNIASSESLESMEKLGIHKISFGGFETASLEFNMETVSYVEKLINSSDYKESTIITHWNGDHHQDHKACFEIAQAAGRALPNLYGFCSNVVSSATSNPFVPNCFIPISEEDVELQIECCKLHKSEWNKFNSRIKMENLIRTKASYFGYMCNLPLAVGLIQYRGLLCS